MLTFANLNQAKYNVVLEENLPPFALTMFPNSEECFFPAGQCSMPHSQVSEEEGSNIDRGPERERESERGREGERARERLHSELSEEERSNIDRGQEREREREREREGEGERERERER